jgi:hypothetical protein
MLKKKRDKKSVTVVPFSVVAPPQEQPSRVDLL